MWKITKLSLQSGLELITTRMVGEVLTNWGWLILTCGHLQVQFEKRFFLSFRIGKFSAAITVKGHWKWKVDVSVKAESIELLKLSLVLLGHKDGRLQRPLKSLSASNTPFWYISFHFQLYKSLDKKNKSVVSRKIKNILLYSVRGLERSELGGSHSCPKRLWDRVLWQVYTPSKASCLLSFW